MDPWSFATTFIAIVAVFAACFYFIGKPQPLTEGRRLALIVLAVLGVLCLLALLFGRFPLIRSPF